MHISRYVLYKHVMNSVHVVCHRMPHHHWILHMHYTQIMSVQTFQIMDNVRINIDTAVSIGSQHWYLLLVVSMYVACAQKFLSF